MDSREICRHCLMKQHGCEATPVSVNHNSNYFAHPHDCRHFTCTFGLDEAWNTLKDQGNPITRLTVDGQERVVKQFSHPGQTKAPRYVSLTGDIITSSESGKPRQSPQNVTRSFFKLGLRSKNKL